MAWLTALCFTLCAGRASAWLETRVVSALATIDVSKDGQAVVVHEIVLRTRGERIKSFSLEGVEPYSEFLPDASVRSLRARPEPAPLLGERADDGTLLLEIDHPRGLKAGRYVFQFGYRTDFLARKRLVVNKGAVELTWVGPRFEDGIDSAKVIFRLPPAKVPPALPVFDDDNVDPGFGGGFDGTLLSQLRRTAEKDEIELVRPHVAQGEPATWQVVLDPDAFSAFSGRSPAAPLNAEPLPPVVQFRGRGGVRLAALLAVILLYCGLLTWRWRFFSRACVLRRLKAKALLPLPPQMRIPLSGLLLAGGLALGWDPEHGSLFGALLFGSLLLTTLRRPRSEAPLRGPGEWVKLQPRSAFDIHRGLPKPCALDPSTLAGCALFVGLLLVCSAVAYVNLSRSPYHALLVVLATSVLLPIFWTGRAADLPLSPALRPIPFLRRLWARLKKQRELKVVVLGRVPTDQKEPDELRLRIEPARARPGLTGIEVALEYADTARDALANPVILVRVVDDSESYRALRSVVWTRGRSNHERVAVIRVPLPSVRLCAATVQQVCSLLSGEPEHRAETQTSSRHRPPSAHSPTRRSNSSGTASLALKGATPAHL